MSNFLDKGFSIRLDFLINEKGITESELAKRIGVSRESINYWRHGKMPIYRLAYLNALSKEFNVKPSWLLYGFIK